ncbi:hypothetical protein AURANDRAFT_10716, partial [Aureococcus anophagefferens]
PPEDAPEPGGATAAYVFESRFESGNLLHAAPYPDAEFDCAMCPDVGTGGHTQWFYFRVDGLRKGVRYRFNVTNFAKADSLYLEGMQPLVYGVGAAKSGVGWRRAGKVVCYSKNTAEAHRQQPNAWRKEEKRRQRGRRGTHTLSFDLTLDDDEPSLYLAYSHPYTYTDLQAFLATLAADPARSATYTRRSLCDTVAGNRCDLLTITAPPAASAPAEAPPPRGAGDDRRRADGDREGESRQRRLVVLSSRVHPGESNASWVMQGILDFLTSDDARAVALRRHFVFKICPMLNPDGVIQGNYRCSNSGMDLNRQWSAPSREAHPPVAALKHLIRMYQTRDAHRVALFCDLHGHSRAKGVFLYGILSDADRYGLRARRRGWRRKLRPGDPRAFPLVLAKAAYGMFTKKKTTFRLGRGKAGTARAVVCRELGVRRSYTLEVSFMGGVAGRHRDAQFTTRDLLDLGGQWCAALVDF